MYAIKLKSDTENQRCINDHVGHNTKSWPKIDCLTEPDMCRTKETEVPEECDIFCCNEQDVDFICHAVAYSMSKKMCRMYGFRMEDYDTVAEERGLVAKNGQKGEDWMYFYRKWDSSLHDIIDLSIEEESNGLKTLMSLDWMDVYKADWYVVDFDGENMESKLVFPEIQTSNIEINTRLLPYNSRLNMTITAGNDKTNSAPHIVELLTRPPPIDNLTIVASDVDVEYTWTAAPGAESFTISVLRVDNGELIVPPSETTSFSFRHNVDPVVAYEISINSNAVDFYGNATTGVLLEQKFYSEFPKITKVSIDAIDCDQASFSWEHVGYGARYKVQVYDIDNGQSVSLEDVDGTSKKVMGLENARKYQTIVYAFDENTRGDSAEVVFISELCRAKDLHSPNQEDTAFELSWESVNLSQKYKIKINPSPADGLVSRYVQSSAAYVEALVPGIQYTVSITAIMKREDGIEVISKEARLFQYTKLLAPKDLCVPNKNLHNSTATLTWTIMEGADLYYLALATCRPVKNFMIRPGFYRSKGQNCPRWRENGIKNCDMKSDWDLGSKYLMKNISNNVVDKHEQIFQLTAESQMTLTGLEPGQIYMFWLGGVNKQTYSEKAEMTFITRLKTTDLAEFFDVTHNSVRVKWALVNKADRYSIIVTHDIARRKRVQRLTVKTNATDIVDLHPNSPYLIEVIAENKVSFSWPFPMKMRTKLAPTKILSPFKPPRGDETGDDYFDIIWNPVEGAESYEVEISGVTDNFYLSERVKPNNLEQHRYYAIGMDHNVEHEIKITAHNRFTDGSITTERFFTRPHTPENFRAVEIIDTAVEVAWDLCDGILDYDINVYDDNNHVAKVVLHNKTTHEFKDLLPNHHYIIVIRAYGHVVSHPATVKLYTKIQGVDYLTMTEVYDDTMKLDWREANGATHYLIYFNYDDGEERVERSDISEIKLEDLTPNSIYTIKVVGMNANTEGMPMFTTVITKLGYIKNLRQEVAASTDKTLMMRWLSVPNADHFILKVTSKRTNKRIQVHKIPAKDSSLLIRDLRPATMYMIEIQAFSDISDSYPTDFSPQTKITPIKGFTVDFRSDILLRLIWNSFSDITYHIFGDNRYWKIDTDDFQWIPDLVADTNYNFTIWATKDIYYSDNTTITALTHMSAPTVNVETRTHTVIKISWSQVPRADQYRIQYVDTPTYKKIVDSGREKTFRMRYLLSEDQNIRVRNLDPYTEYLFFVRAERGQQIGENGTITDYTRLSPTQAIEIKSRTDKTSQLSWASVSGAIGYTIKYQAEVPVQNEELSIYVEKTKETLKNLLPGSSYKLIIIAEAPETSGQPANDEFDTFLEAPEEIITSVYDTYTKTICWKPVFMAEGYTMNYASIEQEDKTSRAKDFTDFVEGGETCGHLDDLLPGLKYQISIWGWNERYDGMKSKYKSATLLEAPQDFQVDFYNNTQIEVTYAAVTRAKKYEISHAKINSSEWIIDGETPDLRFSVNALTPFTEYELKIVPINKVTRGYESDLNHWSKLNPIQNFKRIKLTPNEVTLKWDSVEHAVKYRVEFVSELSNLTVQESDYAGIIITGLEETTLYNITVEPFAANGVPGVKTLYPVITEAKTVEDLIIADIEPWRMILEWTGTEKAIAYEVHVNSTEYTYITRVRTNRAFIRQLEPGIRQSFKVFVVTKISRSQPVPVSGFTTLPLPDSARVTKITHSKVMTKWNTALEDWAPAFDDLYYRCVLIKDWSNETVVNTTTTDLNFDFTNLELNTRYTIILNSESPDTSSDERIIEIRTLLPDSPDLDMNEINDKNVVLSWNKTEGLNYAVYVKPLTCPADKVVICEIEDTKNVVVEGLVPACLYDLIIYGQICPKDRKLTIEDDRKRIANQMFYSKLESVTDIEIIEEDRLANMSWGQVPETSYYVVQWSSPEIFGANMTKTSELEQMVAGDLQPNTLYEGTIWGTNPDTTSNPSPFKFHTKMTRVNATLSKSGPDFFEYSWEKVEGAERYDFIGMPQFPGVDPFSKSTLSTSIKFEELIDGSLYLIESQAVNDDTTSVLSQDFVWTRLFQPNLVLSNIEDTTLTLLVEHVNKATRVVGMINEMPIDVALNASQTQTEIVVGDLEQGSLQSIKIQAINDNCTSHFVEKSVMLLLSTPGNITVLPSADSVTLEWSPILKASNYLLEIEGENSDPVVIEVRIPQYTFFGLSAGSLYKISIQAVNEETKSAEAKIETYTRLDTLSQINLLEIEPTSFSLEWNTVEGASEYEITTKQHYSETLNLTETVSMFTTTNSTFIITDLYPGAKYSYAVAGKNLNTVSDAEIFTIFTELENIPALSPVKVRHTDMTLSWGFVPNAVEFVVELLDEKGRQIHTETVEAQETEWIANSVELKNLQPGAFYNISVQAFNEVTQSNIAIISQYTLLNPFDPTDVLISEKRPEGIIFSWQPINGATNYKIIIDKDFEFTYFMDRGQEQPLTLTTNKTYYDVSNLLPDTKYKYELVAFNPFTFSESFFGYEATLLPDIETAEIVEKTYASFKAQWTNVPGAADYLVQLRYTNGQVLFLTSLFKAEIDLRFGSLLPGVSYTLSIIGRNEITETRSKSLSVWTKLSPILNLRSNDDELQEDTVVLEWEAVPNAAYYHMVILELEADIVVFQENITENYYERKNLTAGTKYEFKIHAVNEFTESDAERIVVATPLSKPTDYQVSVFHPFLIRGAWKLGDALAPRHRRITWRCGSNDPELCDCTNFDGCPGHYVLKKIRADGEKSWTPEMLNGGDTIDDSIQLDNKMVYRMCIRAENPQTGENSRPFCVTIKTGKIEEESQDDQRLCIERDLNWIKPLDMIPAILNDGEWSYKQTPDGVIPDYNLQKTATCKKIGKVYRWDLKDFIRIHQKSCSPGWMRLDTEVTGETIQCLFPKHKSGSPIFPKSMIDVNYCEKRSVDPKRPWLALRNVANGGRCGCHYLKACERWDYKPFPGFTVRNAAPIITMPLVKNEQACLKKCDIQRERECTKIPQVVKEGKTNCACKNCCLMTTLSADDGCVLFTSSLNRTSTRIEARDETTVFTNFLGAQGSPGFRLLDFTNNGVARPDTDFEVTLSFSYASETCVRIIFDRMNETEAVYHDIIIRKGRDYSKSKPCMETYPTLNFYSVEHVIDYDLEEGETIKIIESYSYSDYGIYDSLVEITSTDDDQAGENIVKDKTIMKKIGINQFGCQYPAIKIEGPWLAEETKTITLPKSKKLILSATSDIQCEINPGYNFRWTAKLVGFDHSF
ncbi:unnamed protein product [Oikopleura dioica]|uniref:Fibronectin type-III domain-containing protein n=1 Tax=Oikopleura dioica TaxID=34765 RepID=E4WVT7_OIKDI|nr:unnamed protein product [Oikopleura dioica]